MKKNFWKLGILGIALILLASCASFEAYTNGNKETINSSEVAIFIPSNPSVDILLDILVENNIINDKSGLKSVIDYKEFTDNKIGSGKYIIAPKTNYKTLVNGFTINKLGNGNKEVEVEVTFNNCRHIYDIAGKVAKNIEMDSTEFVNYILSDSVLTKYGFTKERIVSLFLPDTYRFYWDTDHVEFVDRMAKEFRDFWTEERKAKLAEIGLKSQSDAVTLASIVYKEQDKHPEEWRTIAGLYLNRVRNNWLLQSDPTFVFCWGDELDGVQRLLNKHREIDCPYNTYKYTGLPPGPIFVPPASCVDAVLNAEKNNYFFMCAKPEYSGLHNFAATLAEHNKNANIFQKWIAEEQRKNK